ncbi:hypothetical protein BO78DRAFT_431964 [Aspergillus sclerotiicarbonarius CBS 121057]|uniref:Uncharacterized protein n=1 Tax=Aspergillus sclerotiicarbonarius (strain CBS 121057 / IBT 28362) TaxID=1448318 RepID=A0A319EIQ7_ASPSB|nr:hypothetical protein BO78DRAFT_431964 [Aspergillus sclerotiicarbonarius CBS 121057]
MSTTSSMEETMKDLLDRGEVKPSWRDKQFVHFLDLKEAYGREFLARVKEHAESTGFSWADLAKFENERRTCSKMFVDKFGMTYWGTPANRQKYLQEECLADPDTLCVYPDRREEIVRTIMILLERKAKGYARLSMEKPKTPAPGPALTNTTTNITGITTTTAPIMIPTPDAPTQPTMPSSIPQKRPNPNPNPNLKSKRQSLLKESDEDYTESMSPADKPSYKIPRTRALSNAIRPFKSVLTESESEAELPVGPSSSSRKIQKPPKPKKKPDAPHPTEPFPSSTATPKATEEPPKALKKEKKLSSIPPPPPPMGTFIHKNPSSTNTPTPSQAKTTAAAISAANYTPNTIFLATTSAQAQENMAPVWIPYEGFTSTSAFLDYMADQCNLVEWNPTTQLTREDAEWYAPSSSPGSVIAASVRFDWSDFEIRVRQGHDEDWVIVQRELVRAWRVEAETGDRDRAGAGVDVEVEGVGVGVGFRIRVVLHVVNC